MKRKRLLKMSQSGHFHLIVVVLIVGGIGLLSLLSVAADADPVSTYAPLVKLYPQEKYFPMSVDEFVADSSLRWDTGSGCMDITIASNVNPNRLGTASKNPYTAPQVNSNSCAATRKTYAANQLTRPGQKDDGRAAGLNLDQGFYLNLFNKYRAGDAPDAKNLEHATVSYTYVPKQYITYFFMYGYNVPPNIPNDDHHEGEWEHVTVRLNSQNKATAVWYFQHNCSAESYSWAQMQTNKYLTSSGHPIVYSADGTHASYPTPVNLPLDGGSACPDQYPQEGRGDQAADGGAQWQTWNNLQNAAKQPWYGFGGAWGQAAKPVAAGDPPSAVVTGPLGPAWKDPGSATNK